MEINDLLYFMACYVTYNALSCSDKFNALPSGLSQPVLLPWHIILL